MQPDTVIGHALVTEVTYNVLDRGPRIGEVLHRVQRKVEVRTRVKWEELKHQ